MKHPRLKRNSLLCEIQNKPHVPDLHSLPIKGEREGFHGHMSVHGGAGPDEPNHFEKSITIDKWSVTLYVFFKKQKTRVFSFYIRNFFLNYLISLSAAPPPPAFSPCPLSHPPKSANLEISKLWLQKTDRGKGWGEKERKKSKRIYCIKSICVPNLEGAKYLVARRARVCLI